MANPQRVILVSGAASGIGAALARRQAGPGVAMTLHGGGSTPESGARLDAVVTACRNAGATCLVATGNLIDDGSGAAAVATTLAEFGRLDQVVHSAGHVDKTPLGDLTSRGLDRSIGLMAGSFLEIVTSAMPALAASGSGRVVAVSSFIAHKIERPTLAPASAAAKAALETLVRCFALQMAASGTTVNAVVPGFTRKDPGKLGSLSADAWVAAAQRTPTGRLNETDDVAAAISFLLSADARQITGALLHVDGGLTLG